MAGKPLNRMELRRQNEAAEPLDPMEDEAEDIVEDADDDGERKPKKKAKAKVKAAPKPRAKAKPKTPKAPKPNARMRIVWAVVSDTFKQVGTFDYNQKEAAEARAAELTGRGKGTHFVQKVKEAMPDDAPGIGAAVPRPAVPVKAAKASAVADNDIEDDEEEAAEEEEEEEIEESDDDD